MLLLYVCVCGLKISVFYHIITDCDRQSFFSLCILAVVVVVVLQCIVCSVFTLITFSC